MELRTEQSDVKLRRATRDDFDALHDLWMQDHISPFMTFEQITKEEFKLIFEELFNTSEIYVIEDADKVVAARRVTYYADDYAHIANFGSFGVH
jgi:hypothetical protein